MSFFEDINSPLVRFSSPNKCGAYIGCIRDHDYDVVYKDERFSNPNGFVDKYIIKFWIDFGGACLWSVNEKARATFGSPVYFEDLDISDELKKDIQKMCDDHDSFVLGEVEDEGYQWKEEDRTLFINNIEKPIFERLAKELGDDFCLIFDEK